MLTENKNLIQVYGAERVGKTTFSKKIIKENPSFQYIHFGIPKPEEENPLSNYNINVIKQNNFLCDRGPLEANIFRPIILKNIRELLNIYLDYFNNITFYIIEKPFAYTKTAHLTEILLDNQDLKLADWKKDSLLQQRMINHYNYYTNFYNNIFELSDLFGQDKIKLVHINE